MFQRLRQIIFPSAGWVAADPELDGRMRRELGIPEREQPEVVVLKKPWENQEGEEEEEEEGRNIIVQMLKYVPMKHVRPMIFFMKLSICFKLDNDA